MMLYHLVVACVVFSMMFADGHTGHHHPYAFGYSVKDHHGEQNREESGIGGNSVKGSYNFKDHRGIHRQADYIADKAGFRAEVKMNEPGTANQNPADINIHSSVHPHFGNPAVHGGYSGYRHGHGIVFTGHDYGKHGYGKGPAAPGILGFAGAGHFGHGHIHGYGY